jgi:hypothetical protein
MAAAVRGPPVGRSGRRARPGGPRSISDEQIEQVLVATLERIWADATHWSRASKAAEAGLSRSTVGRTWRAFGLAASG